MMDTSGPPETAGVRSGRPHAGAPRYPSDMRLPFRALLTSVTVACALVGTTSGTALAAPSTGECGPYYTNQLSATPWPLQRLNPSAAWPLSRGTGVIVAVIDSGVSDTHPRLQGQVLVGKDFLGSGKGTCDESGHGTVVAGIIAGRDTVNEAQGAPFYGVAPGAKILPIRVLPNVDKTDDPALPGRIADAIRWAVKHDARVINLSLTTPPTQDLADAVAYAESRDVVVVAAAGNEGGTAYGQSALYPAAYPGVLAVAGVDQKDNHVSTSNSGTDIAISAPGVYIEGPAPRGGGYVVFKGGGTSFAAAYVSGVAALVRAYYPSLDAAGVVRRIRMSADPAPYMSDGQFGDGVVNPYWAVAVQLDVGGDAMTSRPPLPPLALEVDPMATAKRAAVWIAPGGAAVAACLLLAAALGRRRRRADAPLPAAPATRLTEEFVPVVGQPLVISAPTVHR